MNRLIINIQNMRFYILILLLIQLNTIKYISANPTSMIWRKSISSTVTELADNRQTESYFSTNLQEPLDYLIKRDNPNSDQNAEAKDFVDYGCWCRRVKYLYLDPSENQKGYYEANSNGEPVNPRGGNVLDKIDLACNDWTKCMRCVQIENKRVFLEAVQKWGPDAEDHKNLISKGCDYGGNMPFSISKLENGELSCEDPLNLSKPCAHESCLCSLDLILKMKDLHAQWKNNYSKYSKEKHCGYKMPKSQKEDVLSPEENLTLDEISKSGRSSSNNGQHLSDILSYQDEDELSSNEDLDYYEDEAENSNISGTALNFGSNSESSQGESNSYGFQFQDDFINNDIQDSEVQEIAKTQKKKVVHRCCGKAPHWRPYKPALKKCCEYNKVDFAYEVINIDRYCKIL